MSYNRKRNVLLTLVIVLSLVYILGLVFDSSRPAAFAWLDSRLLDQADEIEIYGPEGRSVLRRRNNVWFFSAGSQELPVRQHRVEDLLAELSGKGRYTLRADSAEARQRLGLDAASRIIIRGGAGLPLLDLLVGWGDATGREVYFARAGRREIYSGEDRLSLYTDSRPGFWYDLRLFPPAITAAMIQEAEISLPAAGVRYSLRRSGSGWLVPGNEGLDLNGSRVSSWLRSLLEGEGEDFGPQAPFDDPSGGLALIEGSITLRLGDGTSFSMQAGSADETGHRYAAVTDSALVYLISERTFTRLFAGQLEFLQ